MKTAVQMFIGPIQVIPIDGEDDLFILEIDITPDTEWCKESFFPIQIPKIDGAKPENLTYFVREGPSSEQIPKKDEKRFLEGRFLTYISARMQQERQNKLVYESSEVKLNELLCQRESFIND